MRGGLGLMRKVILFDELGATMVCTFADRKTHTDATIAMAFGLLDWSGQLLAVV